MEWILENKEWLFSGVGLSVLAIVGGILFNKKQNSASITYQIQKSGKGSVNIQIGAGASNVKVENNK